MTNEHHARVAIIGAGPAGYTSAIYTGRAALQPILFEGIQPGGQLTITTEVENFPGFETGVQGPELMQKMRVQAERFGTAIIPSTVDRVDFSRRPFVLESMGRLFTADSVIIATGASAKYLGLPSEERFRGMGVSACATCDGPFYRDRIVVVIGGGDSAIEEASHLSHFAKKVILVHRRNELRASKIMQRRLLENPKVELMLNFIPVEVLGDETGVTGCLLKNVDTQNRVQVDCDGFFLAIGHHPNTEIFKDQCEMDDAGYIRTVPGSARTSVEGVFAAGDVQDSTYRQAITAAGSGCMAAIEAERYLAGPK